MNKTKTKQEKGKKTGGSAANSETAACRKKKKGKYPVDEDALLKLNIGKYKGNKEKTF